MIGCDYCDEWFHPDCLSLTTEEANLLTEQKWKCPVCEEHIDGQNSDDQPKRTKINVGPGEWLWLVGDQLIAPTKEEIYLERKKRPSLEEDVSDAKRFRRNWANHRCRRCGEEFVSKASMREHDCGMWRPRKEDWN